MDNYQREAMLSVMVDAIVSQPRQAVWIAVFKEIARHQGRLSIWDSLGSDERNSLMLEAKRRAAGNIKQEQF